MSKGVYLKGGLFKGIVSYIINASVEVATEVELPEGYGLFEKGDLPQFLYIPERSR